MDDADMLMESKPDSSLAILSSIDKNKLGDDQEKARYALLMSMALDKNYIDTATFDVLQPAIDYYLENGTPDEKLRTYYYRGCVFKNMGERDSALNSFTKAMYVAPQCEDSLVIARTLVARACIYYEFYDFKSYLDDNVEAANIYRQLSHKPYEFDCMLRILNGAVLMMDKNLSDSILDLCHRFKPLDKVQKQKLQEYTLAYAVNFGLEREIRDLIHDQENNPDISVNGMLNLAFAYNKIGDCDRAAQLLGDVAGSGMAYDTLKYLSMSLCVLENIGDYKESLAMYKRFNAKIDSLNVLKFQQKAQYIEEKHNMELKAQSDARAKTRMTWGFVMGIVILFMGLFIMILLVRSGKAQKELALQRVKAKDLENARLKAESEKLVLEAEILTHRVEALENERDSLIKLMEAQDALPSEVQDAIKIRLEMLNSLLAGYITDNEQFGKSYEARVRELTDNTEEFMNSNRLAFRASHPRFIQYFEDHNLTVSEINYVCLYAIGLKGKDVGAYMKKRSHVNISSAIRKKIGIDKHETNLGIYVRRLLKSLG